MLIVEIKVNDKLIDRVMALNVRGDMEGVCEYKITSWKLGNLGDIEHDRKDGAYKLTEQMMKLVAERIGERGE